MIDRFEAAFVTLPRFGRSSLVAALLLSLGIGSGAAMFALLDAALLETLPYPEPDRLVRIWATDSRAGVTHGGVSFDDYRAIEQNVTSFDDVAFSSLWLPSLSREGGGSRIRVARASVNLFATLGVAPERGRVFDPRPEPQVVLSRELADQLFGDANAVPGNSLDFDGTAYTVVGVMPAGFDDPLDAEAWVPAETRPTTPTPARDGAIVARLRSGVALETVRTELATISGVLAAGDPTWTADRGLELSPLQEEVTAPVRKIVLLLTGAVAVFFLIACASSAQLLFVANLTRRQDFAVRSALGASRGILRAQMLAEAVRVAALGCLGGVILAVLALDLAERLIPEGTPRLAELHLDGTALLVLLGLGALAASSVGILSGWRVAGGGLPSSLAAGGRRSGLATSGATPVRSILVTIATAAIVLLTFGAVTLAVEMWRTTHADLGFHPEGVYSAEICAPPAPSDDAQGRQATAWPAFEGIRESLPTVAGVRAVAIADASPVGSYNMAETFMEGIEGFPEVRVRAVDAGYFDALGIPILSGRPFASHVGPKEKVAVVSRAFGERFWPGEEVVGRQLMGSWDADRVWITVVGVAENVRRSAADDDMAPEVYVPFSQQSASCGTVLVATGSGGSASLVHDKLEQAVGPYELSSVSSLEVTLAERNWRPRLRATVIGLFGALSLVFGAAALYATLGQLVASRVKELATRSALGATPGGLVRHVLGSHAVPVGIGLVAGAVASGYATRLARASIPDIQGLDPLALGIVGGLLAMTAFAAALGPALRSGRVDVMDALRGD